MKLGSAVWDLVKLHRQEVAKMGGRKFDLDNHADSCRNWSTTTDCSIGSKQFQSWICTAPNERGDEGKLQLQRFPGQRLRTFRREFPNFLGRDNTGLFGIRCPTEHIYIYIYIGGEEAQLALKLKRSNSGNDWVGMDLETISQNASCYFGLVGGKEKKLCTQTHPHRDDTKVYGLFHLALLAALFFQWPPRKRGFPKICFSSPNNGMNRGRKVLNYTHFANKKSRNQLSTLFSVLTTLNNSPGLVCFIYLV